MDRMVEYFEDLGDEYEIPGYDVEYQVSSCKKVCVRFFPMSKSCMLMDYYYYYYYFAALLREST